MTEKVMILGADGMLGQLAAKFFAAKYEVIILNDRYIPSSRSKYIDKIIGLSPTAIINCVGKINFPTESSIPCYSVALLFEHTACRTA